MINISFKDFDDMVSTVKYLAEMFDRMNGSTVTVTKDSVEARVQGTPQQTPPPVTYQAQQQAPYQAPVTPPPVTYQAPAAQQQSPAPVAPPPVTPPQQQAAPAQTTTPYQVVPTTAVPQAYTQDQLAVAMTGFVDQGRSDLVMQILAAFGVGSLMQVPKERYADLALELRKAGANI